MRRISVLRRRLLAAVAAWALAAPLSARAQGKPARIGWLTLQENGMYAEVTSRGFVTGLRDSCQEEMNLIKKSAEKLGLTVVPISVMADAIDLETALKRAQAAKVQAVMTAPMTTNLDITDRLAALATRYGIPFIHDI